jgi:DNA excision repair protein ERCC-2
LKTIIVPLREFALPIPRTGSIEVHSGYGRAAAEGQEIHSRVQKQRAKADPLYRAEVPISGQFDRNDYRFRIDGRMDGIFHHDQPLIEEIKSAYHVRELTQRLAGTSLSHPYALQLLTYGYLYWLDHQVCPRLSFHLVSTRSGTSEDLPMVLNIPEYENWLAMRLDELVLDAKAAEQRAARRRNLVNGFSFPFARPRPGQLELMQTVQQGMTDGQAMLIQAPTGLGKTVAVLYPVLKEALGRGQKVVYVTPKNSQHAVAEDCVSRFHESGTPIRSLAITAKGKICFKDEPLCNPAYCEYARDYYTKLHANSIQEILARKRKLTRRTFRKLGEQYQVCPFELQFDGAAAADVIICDYNYVFAPRSSSGRLADSGIGQDGKANLVIDEAHNLPARGMDNYSATLAADMLEQLRAAIRLVPSRFRREAEELLNSSLHVVQTCCALGSGPMKIEPPVARFQAQDGLLRSFLSRYLEAEQDLEPDDPILRLCSCWGGFTEVLELVANPERQEFFATFHPHQAGGTLRVTCCDASLMLHECYADFEQVVGFSATLKPFSYYARLSGLDTSLVKTAEFHSPFPREKRKLLVIPQVSTRYSQRERHYARIAEAIERIIPLQRGNYLVFFPGFQFLTRVHELFEPPAGFSVLIQERDMKLGQVEVILDQLRSQAVPTIVFAVQGGSFSEGIDYAGEMVIGAFVVGPPLPVTILKES